MRYALRALRVAALSLLLLPTYGAMAYVVLPLSWRGYTRLSRRPHAPGCTRTFEGIPGDPINVGLAGSRADLVAAMAAAGWVQADRITFSSGLRDAASVLLDRPYPAAPMSTHFLFERSQDLAFERADGRSPRRRHHVRFWQSGPSAWVGAATFDRSVGVSHFTGEVMHHIDPDVDAERRELFRDLARTGRLAGLRVGAAQRPAGEGRNGGGDRYRTDGRLWSGTLLSE